MNAQRNRFTHRGGHMLSLEALLVEAVSCFVQNAVEGDGEVSLVIPSGQTNILRSQISTEGMHRCIDTARFQVKPHGSRHFFIEGQLPFDGVVSLQKRGIHRLSLFHGGGQKGNHKILESTQNGVELGAGGTWLVEIHQGIIRMIATPVILGLFAAQVDECGEIFLKPFKLACLSGLCPARLGQRTTALHFFDKCRGQLGGFVMVLAPTAHIGLLL